MQSSFFKIFFVLILFAFFSFSNAQPQLILTKKISEKQDLHLTQLIASGEGNFYASGWLGENAYLVKLTENGEILWEKEINKGEVINTLQIDSKKNIIALMNKIPNKDSVFSKKTAYVLRFDAQGTPLSEYQAPPNFLFHFSLKPYNENEWLAIFKKEIIKDSLSEQGIARLNENGEIVWQQTYQANNEPFMRMDFQVLSDNKFIFMATKQDSSQINQGFFQLAYKYKNYLNVIHCDINGQIIRQNQTKTKDIITNILPTSDGNVLLASMHEVSIREGKDTDADIKIEKVSPQDGSVLWEKNIHLYEMDMVFKMKEMPDNHFVIFATYRGAGDKNDNYHALIELDKDGNTIWSKVFRDGTRISDIVQLPNGEYLATGFYEQDKQKQAYIWRFSKNACFWQKSIEEEFGNKQPCHLTKDKKDGYFMSGINFTGGGFGNTIFTYHLDNEGNITWGENLGSWNPAMEVPATACATKENHCIALNNKDGIYEINEKGDILWKKEPFRFVHIGAILPTKEENEYFLSGFAWENYPKSSLWLGKMNENGKEIWQKKHNFELPVEVWDMEMCSDKGFILAANAGETGKTRFQLIKTSENGEVEWDKVFQGEKYARSEARSVLALKEKGYVLAGFIFDAKEKDKAYLIKTNEKGETEWELSFVKTSDDIPSVLVEQDQNGNLILAATHKRSNYKGEQEIYVAKISLEGKILWEKFIGGANSHELGGLAIMPDNQILIVGSVGNDTHDDKSKIYIAKVRND